ncbi:MAG TPA: gamma-glutamyltransferase family protein [Gryllotalpicola sp.]
MSIDPVWVPQTTRPEVLGTKYVVSAGHYLASAAGIRILDAGGNAFDAGVAAALCINVVQADMTNLGGVAPIAIYDAKRGVVETISGLGWWPEKVDVTAFERETGGRITGGILDVVMPAAADAWLTVLERYGTKTLAEVAAPAIELCEDGFPLHTVMDDSFKNAHWREQVLKWPSTRDIFAPGGEFPEVGDRIVQRDLGRTLRKLVAAEAASEGNREDGIRAARDRFYTGDIAEMMVAFIQEEGGWLSMDDLAKFHVEIEPGVSIDYHGYEVYACDTWCQGGVVPMTLNILEGWDLAALEPGSVELIHLELEAMKAAFADRERYFGDPHFTRVPMDGLLNKEYGEQWRGRLSASRAEPGMPEPGDPWPFSALTPDHRPWAPPVAKDGPSWPDTSYLCVVDADGNAFSATPSDGIVTGPVVPGLGFSVSGRGSQSWLDPAHPFFVTPYKRPRLTPSPGMVLKDGKLAMPYGSPGNDVQPQAMVQFLVNFIDFGMNVQAAIEAPRVATYSFPRSTDPHPYTPGFTQIEGRFEPGVAEGLRALGHDVYEWPDWAGTAGSINAIYRDSKRGVLRGGADPRRIAYAIGR